ncbi:hypothetical protein K502DRAFT_353948, partial [Neoconidiobolus thromboides FSU 785]
MTITTFILVISLIPALYFYFFFLKKPSNLAHLPSRGLIDSIKAIFYTAPIDIKIEAFNSEILKKHKVQVESNIGSWTVLVSCPKAAKMIYNDTINFPKEIPIEALPNSLFSKFMGINLVFSNHNVWKRHRKVLNPPFKKQFSTQIFTDAIKGFFKVAEKVN